MSEKKAEIPNYVKFINGGLAGCGAVCFVQPIDVVKARMQVSGEGGKASDHKSSFHAIRDIYQKEGLLNLYKGFSANVARQLAYTMTRLGIFQTATEKFAEHGIQGFKAQVMSGLMAGFIASLIALPTDVSLIRMAVDGRLPENERRKYKHVGDAIFRIATEEGITKLYTGGVPTVARAMVGNVFQLVPYVQAKKYFLQNGIMSDNFGCHFVSSLLAGLSYAFTSAPFDMAKTRLQSMKRVNGKGEYRGMLDVWMKILKYEGPLALWKGFVPCYMRIAPFTILMFLFVENLTKLYKIYVLGDREAKGGL